VSELIEAPFLEADCISRAAPEQPVFQRYTPLWLTTARRIFVSIEKIDVGRHGQGLSHRYLRPRLGIELLTIDARIVIALWPLPVNLNHSHMSRGDKPTGCGLPTSPLSLQLGAAGLPPSPRCE
jgi:hypothetical protein